MPSDLPIYNAYIQIEYQHVDPAQSLIPFLNCLSFLEDLVDPLFQDCNLWDYVQRDPIELGDFEVKHLQTPNVIFVDF